VRAQTTAFLAVSAHPAGKVPVVLHPGEGKLAEWSKIYSEATQAQTIPVICSWHLNERMYGELQGLDKAETIEKYGKEQVHIWRRSFDVPPPGGESLAMTAARTIPYFKEQILPQLNGGKNVLICAHGNSLRSIVMDLDGLTNEQVLQLEIATGEPSFYTFQNNQWKKE
jgi:2,3-bisphosphoglycerate-dependent phosphoglycerate mutase